MSKAEEEARKLLGEVKGAERSWARKDNDLYKLIEKKQVEILTKALKESYERGREEERDRLRNLNSCPEWQDFNGRCNKCGGECAIIRGQHPGKDKRRVCPTCLKEHIEWLDMQLQTEQTATTKD